mgnify:CR=1
MKKSIIKFTHKCTTKVAVLCSLFSFPIGFGSAAAIKITTDPIFSKSISYGAPIIMATLFIPVLANVINATGLLEAPAKIVSNSNNDAIQHNENIKSLPKPVPMAKINLKENFHKF